MQELWPEKGSIASTVWFDAGFMRSRGNCGSYASGNFTLTQGLSWLFVAGFLLPRALRALRCGLVAILDPVVNIAVTHRAQGLVVETGNGHAFAQLFRKGMDGLQMVRGRGNLQFGSLKKF